MSSNQDKEVGADSVGGADRRPALLVGLVGLGLLVVGLGVVAAADDDDVPRMEVSAGTNLAVTGEGEGFEAFTSPVLVANPTNPEQLVVAARRDRPQLGVVLRRSPDRGASWSESNLALPPGETRAYAPDVAFDAAGNLFVAYATMSEPANNPTGLWLSRSGDGGASFAAPTRLAGPYAYQPRLAVSGPNVYVSFVQATAAVESITNGFGPPPNPVMMAASADGGASFAAPVMVSSPDRQRVGGASPAIGTGGAVFVLYSDYGDDAIDLEGRPGGVHAGRFSLVLARAGEGGVFSDVGIVDDALVPATRFNPYTPAFASLAIDTTAPGGDVMYVAWSDARGGSGENPGQDVWVRRSRDSGSTWSSPVKVANPDSSDSAGAESTDQYLPHIDVAPTGRVDVAYLDRSADNTAAASLATSFDLGETWNTISVSDATFDATVGPEGIGGGTDPGSRIGLVSGADAALAVWPDARNGSVDTGRLDVFFAPVRIIPET